MNILTSDGLLLKEVPVDREDAVLGEIERRGWNVNEYWVQFDDTEVGRDEFTIWVMNGWWRKGDIVGDGEAIEHFTEATQCGLELLGQCFTVVHDLVHVREVPDGVRVLYYDSPINLLQKEMKDRIKAH